MSLTGYAFEVRRMAKVNLALPVGVPHLSAGFEAQWIDRRFDDPVSSDTTIASDRWSMPQLGRSLRLTLQLRY